MRASREDGQGGTPRSRAFRRSRRPLTDSERIAAVAAEADVPVEEVLRDVADFRLALETDMIIAAAAVDADNPDVLAEVIDGERLELATFHDRLLTRLADAAADDEIALRRARRAPRKSSGWVTRAVSAAAAAAAVVAMAGVGRSMIESPATTSASDSTVMQTADRRYADFSTAMSGDSAAAVHTAAEKLHDTLEALIQQHASDPEVAQRAAQLLQAEIALLQIKDPAGVSAVLAEAHSLAKMLKQAAPAAVRATVAPVLDAAMSSRPSPKPKATKSPTPSPKPTASPSPSPTRSSSSKSSDPENGTPLDTP